MIPEHEKAYEADLRRFIASHRREENHHRAKRQDLEAKLRALLLKRGDTRLQNGCPPAFAHDCVLEDETRCLFYHDGQCVKAQEVA